MRASGRLTTGRLARLADVGVETIRFYERQGLLDEPPRGESGYREYAPETVKRLRFIRRAKELGFTLREIKELLTLRVMPGATCADVRRRAEAKRQDIAEKIRSLEKMDAALAKLSRSCRGKGPVGDCPILDALEDDERWSRSS